MPFSVHSTLEKHMRKCVVMHGYTNGANGGYRRSSSLKTSVTTNNAPIAEANSLLALSKAPVSLNNSPNGNNTSANAIASSATITSPTSQLPSNIAQSNQMVLNWLQALNVNATTVTNGPNPLPSGGSAREETAVEDEDMDATEASELVASVKMESSTA
jgi:hypothetical protein